MQKYLILPFFSPDMRKISLSGYTILYNSVMCSALTSPPARVIIYIYESIFAKERNYKCSNRFFPFWVMKRASAVCDRNWC